MNLDRDIESDLGLKSDRVTGSYLRVRGAKVRSMRSTFLLELLLSVFLTTHPPWPTVTTRLPALDETEIVEMSRSRELKARCKHEIGGSTSSLCS
jgi:hypothetical protein